MTTGQASFSLKNYNPDVLSCIANLSNDEVFTPPEFANQMLDTLAEAWAESHNGANIWADPTVKFLDPFTKSGVFLREITTRLTDGLATWMPDLQSRVDHILTRQVYGIGITQLTALLARRSVYCSKFANGPHSIAKSFDNPDGNIWFERTEHTWAGDRCGYCGASKSEYARTDDLETHAYAFIHTSDIRARINRIFGADMKFDVIIGNPPYQLADGGGEGSSASPLYHRFVDAAKGLEPSELLMVVPARWYSGGKGLDEFRESMLGDGGLAEVHDFPETDLVFPGVNIRGGVCYFRWTPAQTNQTRVVNYRKDGRRIEAVRPPRIEGISTFVRYNESVSILNKVQAFGEATFDKRVQSRNPFGIGSNFSAFSTTASSEKSVLLFRSRRGESKDREVYISMDQVLSNRDFVHKRKVLVSKASPGGDEYPHLVLGQPFLAPEGSASTETYLIACFPDSDQEAENIIQYMRTSFFRFLVSLIKNTQNISRSSFGFVPVQDFSRPWNDADLYAKYAISADEQTFINSLVKPMGLHQAAGVADV